MGLLLIYLGAVLFAAYWGWGTILYWMQPKFLYKPVKDVTYTPEELSLDYEDVVFKTDDGLELNGWYVPSKGSEFTVLLCHGNGGNITHRLDSINMLHDLGLSCFVFDYRGYGNSQGKPSEEGTYIDARAAYKWLTRKKKAHADHVIVFGRSLGGAVAARLATKVKPRALVLESSFTSYVDMGRKFYPYMPVRWFARFAYRTIDYVRQIHCPVLMIHSRYDEIVPFEFGLELYEAANEPKEMVEISGGHNDAFLISGETYKSAWTKWLKFLTDTDTRSVHQHAS